MNHFIDVLLNAVHAVMTMSVTNQRKATTIGWLRPFQNILNLKEIKTTTTKFKLFMLINCIFFFLVICLSKLDTNYNCHYYDYKTNIMEMFSVVCLPYTVKDMFKKMKTILYSRESNQYV